MDARADLLLMQITDSAFPIGAYTHSFGLETYIQLGIVCDENSARDYLNQQLRLPLTYTELLGMRLAFEATEAHDLVRVAEIEATLVAARVACECREGSKRMATRLCKTALDFLEGEARETFAAYASMQQPHMLSSAFGVFAALAGIDKVELMRRFLFGQVQAIVTNCVKAIPLSQTQGQRLLFAAGSLEICAVTRALEANESLLGLSTPGFDARSIEHETLYSRLYMS